MMLRNTSKKNQKFSSGQLMIFIVLLMTAIFSIALVQSAIFTNAVRQSRLVIDSVRAFYAADSGVELSLYRYFKNKPKVTITMTNNTFCCEIDVKVPTSTFGTLQVKSSGYSPYPSTIYKIIRSIETKGL